MQSAHAIVNWPTTSTSLFGPWRKVLLSYLPTSQLIMQQKPGWWLFFDMVDDDSPTGWYLIINASWYACFLLLCTANAVDDFLRRRAIGRLGRHHRSGRIYSATGIDGTVGTVYTRDVGMAANSKASWHWIAAGWVGTRAVAAQTSEPKQRNGGY